MFADLAESRLNGRALARTKYDTGFELAGGVRARLFRDA